MRSRSVVLVFFLLLSGISVSAQDLSPSQVVRSFYIYDRAHSQVVNHTTVNARRQWFSDALYKRFRAKVDDTIEYQKQHPDDKPFFGDGFPFTPYEENCDAGAKSLEPKYHVGKARIRSNTATVPVTVSWPRQCNVPHVIYNVKLIRSRSGWRIDDLIYDDGSTLTAAMKEHRYN